jgi:YebC/PmpR family DNA-binding regulatory protein
MSGHSKWSKIKHQKAVSDVRKGKIFSSLARQITLVVREGKSGDPEQNPRLRMVLEKAREANLPKENVQRAIHRGLGKGDEGTLTEVVVEGYGQNGVAIMVTAMTDNRNRTTSELKSLFDRYGGSTGEPGSVSYVFSGESKQPSFTIPLEDEGSSTSLRNLLDALTEQEDVEIVRHNASFTDANSGATS